MWKKISKVVKIAIVFFTVLFVLIIAALIAAPYIAKNYINENGKELIGRTIQLDDVSINYLKGSLALKGLAILEENDKELFFGTESFFVDAAIWDCLNGEYTVETIQIDGLTCHTVLDGHRFNFDSILDFFATEEDSNLTPTDTSKAHYFVNELSVTNSTLSYLDKNLGTHIGIESLNLLLADPIEWHTPQYHIHSDFQLASGGKIESKFKIDIEEEWYNLNLHSNHVKLDMLKPYVTDFMLVKEIGGELNTALAINSHYNDPADVNIIGQFELDSLYLMDTNSIKVAGLSRFMLNADSINPAHDVYQLNSIHLDGMHAQYEMYAEDDNFSRMMIEEETDSTSSSVEEESFSNVFIMIKDYVVEALHGIKASNFSIDTVAMENGHLRFEDHTLLQQFDFEVEELNLEAYNVKSDAEDLLAEVNAVLNGKGKANVKAHLHPTHPDDVNLTFTMDDFAMKDLSPYFHHYLGTPIVRGNYNMTSTLEVKDHQLTSENDLLIEKFTLGKKQNHDQAMNLPVKMGVAMLKNREGNIPINVPVEGNLDDPKYKVWKTVSTILKEMLIKAATSPYNLIANSVETDEDSSKKISLKTIHDTIAEADYNKLSRIAEVLLEKPDLKVVITPYYDLTKMKERIAVDHIKAKYLNIGKTANYTTQELQQLDDLNEKDSAFVVYINQKSKPKNRNKSIVEKALLLDNVNALDGIIQAAVKDDLQEMISFLTRKGVKQEQLNEILSPENIFHDQSDNKNLQYHILFDVIE